jgi:hypothetical protein
MPVLSVIAREPLICSKYYKMNGNVKEKNIRMMFFGIGDNWLQAGFDLSDVPRRNESKSSTTSINPGHPQNPGKSIIMDARLMFPAIRWVI